ncbi:MAG: DoxX family protein [Microvirga sp.]
MSPRSPRAPDRASAYAATLLRISLGTMYLAHGIVLKGLTFGLAGTAGYFGSLGLPPLLAYATFAAEAIGGTLLVLGIWSRWTALALTPVLVGALCVHAVNGWVFTAPGGGWEYPLLLLVLSLVQALLGDGAYAMRPARAPAPRADASSMSGQAA